MIAAAGAFVAGGTTAQILISAVFSEVFFGSVWRYATSAQRHAAYDPGADPEALSSVQPLAPPDGNSLHAGQQLHNGQCLRSSNGRYLLIMWHGQLAIWGPDDTKPVWTTGTGGSGADHAVLDDNGRLGFTAGTRCWSRGKARFPVAMRTSCGWKTAACWQPIVPMGKKCGEPHRRQLNTNSSPSGSTRPFRSHLHLPRHRPSGRVSIADAASRRATVIHAICATPDGTWQGRRAVPVLHR